MHFVFVKSLSLYDTKMYCRYFKIHECIFDLQGSIWKLLLLGARPGENTRPPNRELPQCRVQPLQGIKVVGRPFLILSTSQVFYVLQTW